ncbi:hypothetical protein KDA_53950 [Dictyobacter alpinus]|uniref:YtkA-like domain-containing protein n=2 Tax=Dictyobacter alpinus TaxID=2014873 RepID=A0A402BEQ1_9CHLR|nr:hypothetical protein KDA_53950 [Dictyobacter alpinus]
MLHTTVQTTDRALLLELTITPKSVGTNTFAARVMEAGTNRVKTDVTLDLYATNSDMDMGTKVIHLQPDGKDAFGAKDELTMDGHWQIRMEVHTHQQTLHQANVAFQILT